LIKYDIQIVKSPDDESVDDNKSESDGVGGLSFNETPDVGSVEACLKATHFIYCDGCCDSGVLEHSRKHKQR
jgi:hypothetical protein